MTENTKYSVSDKEMEYFHNYIADKILISRRRQGLTQKKIAKRMNVHHSYISKLEKSPTQVTLSSFLKYLQAAQMTLTFEPCKKGDDGNVRQRDD